MKLQALTASTLTKMKIKTIPRRRFPSPLGGEGLGVGTSEGLNGHVYFGHRRRRVYR